MFLHSAGRHFGFSRIGLNLKPESLLVLAAALFVLASAPNAQANLYLFESNAVISYSHETAGVYYYDLCITSTDKPFREFYFVLDPGKVVLDNPSGPMSAGIEFVNAEITSEAGIDLFFSADRRSLANMDQPRLLDDNMMDAYDPNDADPLADNSFEIKASLGFNQFLDGEEYRLGYWAGDLRGMIDPNFEFNESDGQPVPEPGTLLLTLMGGAGLLRFRRKRAERN
jgi:hypothetical protein